MKLAKVCIFDKTVQISPLNRCLAPSQLIHKHLWWTGEDFESSCSCLLVHSWWKVDSEAKKEPSIQTEHLSSGETMFLIFIVLKSRAVIFCILLAMTSHIVVSPDSSVLAYRSLWMSTSHFIKEEKKLEKHPWTLESLIANDEHLPIGDLIIVLQGGGCSGNYLLFKIQGNIA